MNSGTAGDANRGALIVAGGIKTGSSCYFGGAVICNTLQVNDSTGGADGSGAFKVPNGGIYVKLDSYFTGTVTVGVLNSLSDYRIKENITNLTPTHTVDNLRPVSFYNKTQKKNNIGFIAHELQEVYPYLVDGEKDGKDYQSVNYQGLIGILVNEIQMMKQEMNKMKQRIQVLEATS